MIRLFFHADLYRRDALDAAADQHRDRFDCQISQATRGYVAELSPQGDAPFDDSGISEFCTDALAATSRSLRAARPTAAPRHESDAPPWELLRPYGPDTPVALGWRVASLSEVRGGAALLTLRHADHGDATVTLRRNAGAPLGIAHSEYLDLMLMNGGSGASFTEDSIGRTLLAMAEVVRRRERSEPQSDLVTALLPHGDTSASEISVRTELPGGPKPRRVAPQIDLDSATIDFDLDEAGMSRLALYDTLLPFAERAYLFLARPSPERIGLRAVARAGATGEAIRILASDMTHALNHTARGRGTIATDEPSGEIDLEALLRQLADADPQTIGVGLPARPGPGHDHLRVLNIRGTGACNSDCTFCVEKFDPAHRAMPKTDTTREMILNAAGEFDMLFFASGEPTIHPKLLEYVELARGIGFTSFGMSSHFRTFADPQFALSVLRAGFAYFDISLHAADREGQLAVNPIDDGGESLFEALKGIAVLQLLARALGMPISITHKIVVTRQNIDQLEAIFEATYARGVRHFILQPVRAFNLDPQRRALVDITEAEIIPRLNELLERTAGRDATIKPYGFARGELFSAAHVEHEQNRVKNVYGRLRGSGRERKYGDTQEELPSGGFRVEVRMADSDRRCSFPVRPGVPVLDEALTRDFELPFGCRMGSCGMCCARIVEGTVDQSTQIFLTPEQVRDGYVLLCQARACSDLVVRMCSDDELDAL